MHDWVHEQSQSKPSKQQELSLKPWRMLQR